MKIISLPDPINLILFQRLVANFITAEKRNATENNKGAGRQQFSDTRIAGLIHRFNYFLKRSSVAAVHSAPPTLAIFNLRI